MLLVCKGLVGTRVFTGTEYTVAWSSLATETNLLAFIFTLRVWELSAGLRRPHPVTCNREEIASCIQGLSIGRFVFSCFPHHLVPGPYGTAGRHKTCPLVADYSRSGSPGSVVPLLSTEMFIWLPDPPVSVYRTGNITKGKKAKGYPCTGTEALYKPYGP